MVVQNAKLGEIRFEWHQASSMSASLIEECAGLFSNHYGVWGASAAPNYIPGERVRLSPSRMKALLRGPDTWVALARDGNLLVGHSIVFQTSVPEKGIISWVTQLVVHSNYQEIGIAKNLLASIFGFSDHFAWGLVTASPIAVRALEKVTRRRVTSDLVIKHSKFLQDMAKISVPYVGSGKFFCGEGRPVVDTSFHLDREGQRALIAAASADRGLPWSLGELGAGEEWLAFTFQSQAPFSLNDCDLEVLLQHSEQKLWEAYERMALDQNHLWARHGCKEIEFLIEALNISSGSRVLDLGCGSGRHSIELARMGIEVIGVDKVASFIEAASKSATKEGLCSCTFRTSDVRELNNDFGDFDVVLALYDVVGSFPDESDNRAILSTIASSLRPGGLVALSVMNMDRTDYNAIHVSVIHENPNALFSLPPSNTMEKTGDVFDPRYYLLDRSTGVVYRREQFTRGQHLPSEIVVRDRRYTKASITALVESVGLEVIVVRHVFAGRFDEEAEALKAKEILVIARAQR